MNISNPSEQQLLLAGYILGDLDVEESHAVERLLLRDPSLQQELAALQSSLDQVYGQETTPPAALKASVLAAAEETVRASATRSSAASIPPLAHTSLVPTPSAPTPPAFIESAPKALDSRTQRPADLPGVRSQFPKKLLLIATGVLAVLSLYLGLQNYRLQQALREIEAQQVAAGEQANGDAELVTYSLDATENATENEQASSVEISVDSDRLTAVLEVRGLPALPDSQVYALWTVIDPSAPATKDTKNAILTAVFTVDEAGDQIEKIVLPSVFRDQTQVQAIAVTVEDAVAPQDHDASPILIYRL